MNVCGKLHIDLRRITTDACSRQLCLLYRCNHPKHWANAPITPIKFKNTNQQKHGVGAAPHTQTKCKKSLQVSCPVATGIAAPGERSKHAQPASPSYPLPLWSTRINNHHHRPTHIRVVSYLLPAGMHDAEDAAPLALSHPALRIRQYQQAKAAHKPCCGASMCCRPLACRDVWTSPDAAITITRMHSCTGDAQTGSACCQCCAPAQPPSTGTLADLQESISCLWTGLIYSRRTRDPSCTMDHAHKGSVTYVASTIPQIKQPPNHCSNKDPLSKACKLYKLLTTHNLTTA